MPTAKRAKPATDQRATSNGQRALLVWSVSLPATPLAALLRDEIARDGPLPFHRFMQLALYHPEYGYYRRARDPFGKAGDFYTAAQLQPVFGILIAARVRALWDQLDRPPDFTIVDLGAGRGEMREAFSDWRYLPVDVDRGSVPARFNGVVFANEFFDALPVDAAVCRGDGFRQMLAGWNGERFTWVEGGAVTPEAAAYIERYLTPCEEGELVEINLEALAWIERIARALERGFLFTVDYGYTRRERARFPQGTLMSYRRHTALEDVLADPGERDITAHVPFAALEEHGRRCGLDPAPLQTLAQTLLQAGEADQFAAALAADDPAVCSQRRLQLKTLLFGMGETFRTLLQARRGAEKDDSGGSEN
jgi:SAM-dependent MidA family methyltransferase